MKKLFLTLFITIITKVSFSQAFCATDCETVVTSTVYNAIPSQCNSDPSHTASMFKLDLTNPYRHKIIAVSRDLLSDYPIGSIVYVKGTSYDGFYQVQDKMNKRYKKRIDILINKEMKVGKWKNVKLTKYI